MIFQSENTNSHKTNWNDHIVTVGIRNRWILWSVYSERDGLRQCKIEARRIQYLEGMFTHVSNYSILTFDTQNLKGKPYSFKLINNHVIYIYHRKQCKNMCFVCFRISRFNWIFLLQMFGVYNDFFLISLLSAYIVHSTTTAKHFFFQWNTSNSPNTNR